MDVAAIGYQELDNTDPLNKFRDKFYFPTFNNTNKIYLCGNSLGLQPKTSLKYINDEMLAWQTHAVEGHILGEHPWVNYHETVTEQLAQITGSKGSEVVAMNSLTVNLHLMLISFFKPTKNRSMILIEQQSFPSDSYAVKSQLKLHNLNPEQHLLEITPDNNDLLTTQRWLDLIEQFGDKIAVVLIPGVQYLTGELLDIEQITIMAKSKGCMVGVDLAHAIGNVPLQLHKWQVDFAVWCSYKYLNSGPGAIGGCYVHEKHHGKTDMSRLEGWWGHDKATRFLMDNKFIPINSVESWQLSNPNILSLAVLRSSLDIFTEAGGMPVLREKSIGLTNYLQNQIELKLKDKVNIITPTATNQRGCQLSLQLRDETAKAKQLFNSLTANGITADWREPDVIRVAPTPLYNSYQDVYNFVNIMSELLIQN